MKKISTKISIDNREHEFALNLRESYDDWIVCLHGLQSSKDLFTALGSDSRLSKFSLLCPDFLGFGDSSKSDELTYDIDLQVKALEQLLQSYDIKTCHFIGHSLGGMVAVRLLNSKNINALSLSSLEGNLVLADCGKSLEVAELAIDEFSSSTYPEIIADLECSDEPSAQLRYQSLQNIPSYVFLQTAKSIVDESRAERLLEILLNSTIPSQIIIGQNGTYASRPKGSHISLREIENSGHFMLLDNPTDTLDSICNFLEDVVRGQITRHIS